MRDTSRMAIHTITSKPWGFETAARKYAEAGFAGVSVWKESIAEMGAARAGAILRETGLSAISLVRGGFFVASDADTKRRREAENVELVRRTAELGAGEIVLVCGADPSVPLPRAREDVREGIERLLPFAEREGVKLAVEPLHPMFADTRSVVSTLKQANDICETFAHPLLGVAVDVYHLWWDPDLEAEIARCGRMGKIFAFHVCDWKSPTLDMVNDRGLMGEGCIDIPGIRKLVEGAGFKGFVEVEIFSNAYWKMDQDEFLAAIVRAWKAKV